MKKTLLAFTILNTFTGVALAQTSVMIYGIVDNAITRYDDGNNVITGLTSGRQSSSRIGFKGTEDLGNGLKAVFTLESGINTDDGSATAGFNRQANVGLQGGFGTVAVGVNNSSMKRVIDKLDAFGNGGLNGLAGIYGTNERLSNSIHYVTPGFGGFSGAITYGFGEVAGSSSANRKINFSASYAARQLGVHFAYDHQNGPTIARAGDKTKTAVLGASYDFGVTKLFASYLQRRTDGAAAAKVNGFNIGASVKLGVGSILASVSRLKNDVNPADKFNLYGVGYVYPMSKRTNLYATYGLASNDGGSRVWSARNGENGSRLALGIKHAF